MDHGTTNFLVGNALVALFGFASGWLGKALHLHVRTAKRTDAILGADPGTSQALLNNAAQSLLQAAQNSAANKLIK